MLDGPRAKPASGTARQLVVICHGVGADGQDLIDLATYWARALPDAAFIAPDGPARYDMAPPDYPHARQWFSLQDRAPDKMAAGVEQARAALDPFIDAELARLGLPPDAYALAGFSQGAMVVLHAGLRRAVPPRAILAFSGASLTPVPSPAARDRGAAGARRGGRRGADPARPRRGIGAAGGRHGGDGDLAPPRRPQHRRRRAVAGSVCLLQRVFAVTPHDGRVNP